MGVVGQISKESLSIDGSWKVAIIQALFNQNITQKLTDSAQEKLIALGLPKKNIKIFHVPGALEIPLAIQLAFDSGYDAAIATGAVIRGETTHYEYVCNGIERGCTHIQLQTKKPIAQAVLTTENLAQALDRCGGNHGDKGQEAAEVVISMLNLKKSIN